MPVWTWADPVTVSGSALVSLVGQAARLTLTTIPTYIGARGTSPERYVRAGAWGWVAGGSYGSPHQVEWADQWLTSPPEGATGVWVHLAVGFVGAVYGGLLAGGYPLGSGRLAGPFALLGEAGWFELK